MMDSSLQNAASSEVSTDLQQDETGGQKEVRIGAWQYVALGLAMGGLFAIWGAGLQVLLPEQVSLIVGSANKAATLGLVTGIAAIVAMVSQPIIGVLSDRTRSRLGRRNIWVLGGSLAAAGIMLLVGHITTIPLLIIVWCGMQAAGNAIQTALTATIPERFPISKRGTVSSVSGIGTMFGSFLGVAIAGLGGSLAAGYVIVGALVLIFGILYTFTAREPKEVSEALARQKAAATAQGQKKLDLPRSADYWWAFAGRFTIFLGYTGVSGYTLYILTDYIHIGQSNATLSAATGVVILSAVTTLTMLVSMAFSGWIADKMGRLKPFVFWSSLGFALPMAIILLFPNWPAMLVAQVITGLSFGLYMTVDQALVTRVLPSMENAARDLGILNIASAGPQVLAPFMASMIIAALGGYRVLFLVALVLMVIGAFCVRPIQ